MSDRKLRRLRRMGKIPYPDGSYADGTGAMPPAVKRRLRREGKIPDDNGSYGPWGGTPHVNPTPLPAPGFPPPAPRAGGNAGIPGGQPAFQPDVTSFDPFDRPNYGGAGAWA
jgi:hypothetical protein